jgi:hypothetical protein
MQMHSTSPLSTTQSSPEGLTSSTIASPRAVRAKSPGRAKSPRRALSPSRYTIRCVFSCIRTIIFNYCLVCRSKKSRRKETSSLPASRYSTLHLSSLYNSSPHLLSSSSRTGRGEDRTRQRKSNQTVIRMPHITNSQQQCCSETNVFTATTARIVDTAVPRAIRLHAAGRHRAAAARR